VGELSEEDRGLIARYDRRKGRRMDALYSVFNQAALMSIQQRDRICINALKSAGVNDLKGHRILDVGCGDGLQLLRFLLMGASPENLHGIDLLPDRVAAARRLHPMLNVVEGNATALPWPDASFDLVTQFTTFSSILKPERRRMVANEIIRVLSPGGHIVWYDFWLNPKNADTHGIRPAEVKSLFPRFAGKFHRLTLAPPLARVVAGRSEAAAAILQALPLLQSHCLAVLSAPRIR